MNDKIRAWVIISYRCCTCQSLEVVCVFVEIQQLCYSMKGKNNPKIHAKTFSNGNILCKAGATL